MAVFNWFNCAIEDIAEKVHNLGSDTLRVMLTNTAPNAADVRVDTDEAVCQIQATSNANEIAAGNGYTKKGKALTIDSSAQAAGVYKLIIDPDIVWTAGPAAMAEFRYVVLYNDTAGASTARPVLGWWDYGSAVTLANTETFTLDLSQVNGMLQGTMA